MEKVYSVVGFYDGPLSGTADFEGRPHWYERRFDEALDEWSDTFDLRLVTPEIAAADEEANRIFDEWSAAFKAGTVARDSGPALPDARQRYDELRGAVDSYVRAAATTATARGQFTFIDSTPSWREMRVTWTSLAN